LVLIGRGGLAYGVGSVIILIVALIIGVVGRRMKESKPERQQEEVKAAALIDHNAEAAGWGAPRQRHHDRKT
jgi:hypothetical protein